MFLSGLRPARCIGTDAADHKFLIASFWPVRRRHGRVRDMWRGCRSSPRSSRRGHLPAVVLVVAAGAQPLRAAAGDRAARPPITLDVVCRHRRCTTSSAGDHRRDIDETQQEIAHLMHRRASRTRQHRSRARRLPVLACLPVDEITALCLRRKRDAGSAIATRADRVSALRRAVLPAPPRATSRRTGRGRSCGPARSRCVRGHGAADRR